jgi:hypothetical protein
VTRNWLVLVAKLSKGIMKELQLQHLKMVRVILLSPISRQKLSIYFPEKTIVL